MQREAKKQSFYDYTLVFVVLVLAAFGLVMLYSTTGYEDTIKWGDSFRSVRSQAVYLLIAVVGMIIVSKFDYHFILKFSVPVFVLALVLLVMVRVWGVEVNGEKRWLRFRGISIQPTEIMKIAVVMIFPWLINIWYPLLVPAKKIPKKTKCIRIFKTFIPQQTFLSWIYMLILAFLSVFLILISNLSSAIIVSGMIFIMWYVATRKHWPFILIMAGLIAFVVLSYRSGFLGKVLEDYQMTRIRVWLDPYSDPDGKGYQILQSLYAVGSGGFFGKGLGQSIQKLGKLPEAQNDMVFAIICEELGLFGAALVIALFAVLIWRMLMIASNAPDLTGMLIVVGVIAHIAVQVIFNICVAMNVMPNTGVSLPFISSGGSAILCIMIEIGLVLSVSDRIQLDNV